MQFLIKFCPVSALFFGAGFLACGFRRRNRFIPFPFDFRHHFHGVIFRPAQTDPIQFFIGLVQDGHRSLVIGIRDQDPFHDIPDFFILPVAVMNFRLTQQEFNFIIPSLVVGIDGGQGSFLAEIISFLHLIAVHDQGLDIFIERIIFADMFIQLSWGSFVNAHIIRRQRSNGLRLCFPEFPDRLLAVFDDQTIQISLFRFLKNGLSPCAAGLVHAVFDQVFQLLRITVLFQSGIRKDDHSTLISLTGGAIILFLHQTITLSDLRENIILQNRITTAEFNTLKFNRNRKFDIVIPRFLLCMNSRYSKNC